MDNENYNKMIIDNFHVLITPMDNELSSVQQYIKFIFKNFSNLKSFR